MNDSPDGIKNFSPVKKLRYLAFEKIDLHWISRSAILYLLDEFLDFLDSHILPVQQGLQFSNIRAYRFILTDLVSHLSYQTSLRFQCIISIFQELMEFVLVFQKDFHPGVHIGKAWFHCWKPLEEIDGLDGRRRDASREAANYIFHIKLMEQSQFGFLP